MPELVRMDNFGKIFLPKKVRERLDAKRFSLEFRDDELVLRPVRDPVEFFGAFKGLARSDVDEVHGEWEEHDGPA